MQRYLDSVLQWALNWQLQFSVSECKFLAIGNDTFNDELSDFVSVSC